METLTVALHRFRGSSPAITGPALKEKRVLGLSSRSTGELSHPGEDCAGPGAGDRTRDSVPLRFRLMAGMIPGTACSR
jgi:hypothetical protein